jgi:predicted ATP-dependent endonuclease of OLD family
LENYQILFIYKIDIDQFRGIKSCKEPIKFSKFTVLLGRNNSGKSSILEALSLLPDPNTPNGITNESKIEILEKLHRSIALLKFQPLLYRYAGKSSITYYFKECKPKIVIEEYNASLIYNNEKVQSNFKNLSAFLGIKFNNKASMENLVIFIPNDATLFQSMESRMDELKELIMKKDYHIKVAKELNECVDDRYSDINFHKPIEIRKELSNTSMYLYLNHLGQGAEKLVKIMALMEVLNPRLLLIDDFEVGFHPSMLRVFLNWLKKKEWQVVISTHSIDVLDKLVELEFMDTTVLLLRKSKDDILDYNILDYEKLKNCFDANSDPRLLPDILHLKEL